MRDSGNAPRTYQESFAMSTHDFSVENIVITGVGYGGMDTRLERTLVCSCGGLRKRISNASSEKREVE